jgi:hypothetical protein
MLEVTKQIINLNDSGNSSVHKQFLINICNEYGTIDDAKALFNSFKQSKDDDVLDPIMFHGDEELSEDLFKLTINNDKLKNGYSEKVIKALSFMEYPKLEEILIWYLKMLIDGNYEEELSWDLHIAVCLGLLNYSCHGYENTIEYEIKRCLPKFIYPELIPCLAIKTKNSDLIYDLYESGNRDAYSDYNSGIVLGMALYGYKHRELFKSIIFDESWKASCGSSGTGFYTFMGMNYLNITFQELYTEIRNDIEQNMDKEIINDKIWVIHNLLKFKINEPYFYKVKIIKKTDESFLSIYNTMFKWNNPQEDDSIIGIYRDYLKEDILTEELNRLEDLIEIKIENEIRKKYLIEVI